ncbi:toll-like receptor 4 [Mytilus trossulus]|uniref:toll-like receptor 4 n=1 Tax=Mytilus trossulus TaxID=6551 RepID=UPI0030069ACE
MESILIFMLTVLIYFYCLNITEAKNRNPDMQSDCTSFYEKRELYIDCSRKNLPKIPDLIPNNTVYLNLCHNYISEIPNNIFQHLTNLILLDLSFNELHSINQQTFTGLKNLRRLQMNDNNLGYNTRQFPPGSFGSLQSLTHLSIQNNEDYGHQTEPFILPDKTISDLTKLEKLELDIDIFDTKNKEILGKGYSFLQNLHWLSLENCYIVLENNTFKYTQNLTKLYFTNCYEVMPNSTNAFSILHQLKVFHLSQRYCFSKETELNNLILAVSQSTIEILIISYTFVGNTTFNYKVINDALILHKSPIRELTLANNPGIVFLKAENVPVPTSLQKLDFSGNSFRQISLNLTYVKYLNLEKNNLGNYLAENTYMLTKDSILEYISLSSNSIYKLNSAIFNQQPYLKFIDLSFNFLTNVHFDFSFIKQLKILNLTNNSITFLDDLSMLNIDNAFIKSSNAKIDLSNNLFQCTCNRLRFLKWMLRNQKHLINFPQYKCITVNGSKVVSYSFEEKINHLHADCTRFFNMVTIGIMSFAIISFLGVLLTVIVYRKRQKLRYMYYRAKFKFTSKLNFNKDLGEYHYDAFVSYSDNDRNFVINDCIQNLEEDGNLKLCLHQRDFTPGEDIADNIINAIQNSRKTICVISKAFLESHYCMFEFNMARMESIHSRDGKNVLFLIFYEKLLPEDIPLVLHEIMQTQTYIEYPNDEYGNKIFWGKIKEALRI